MKRTAIAFALGFVCACAGSADQETSLRLIVNNGAGLAVPVEVSVEVFEGTSQLVRDSIARGVPPGATSRLGDVVVYPAPGTLALRFAISGRKDGSIISSTVVSAAPKEGQQVEVVATLKAGQTGITGVDGGAGFDSKDTGANDTNVVPAKRPGEVCASGSECASGTCLDKICCDKACNGVCNTCKAPGMPAGMCTALVDGTKCADATCSGNKKTLTQRLCIAGACVAQEQSCAKRQCTAATLMCN